VQNILNKIDLPNQIMIICKNVPTMNDLARQFSVQVEFTVPRKNPREELSGDEFSDEGSS
jgi:hypothetical protein